jgi:DNA polymerase-1
MPTLVLVDGSSYLYRAFHALPDLRTSRGEPTGALRGVLSMLRRIAEDEKPDYFAVVFDAPGKTFRDDWYPQYKAQRAAMPDDLVRQIEPLHDLVRAHGWPLLMVEGVEADDVIGTLAVAASAAGIDCVISRSTRISRNSCGPRVRLVNTMTNETLDEAGVLAKFGVRADQVLDLLALTGDAVDNVPGAEGRTQDGGEVARAIRHARLGDRARERCRRRRRRQSARDARLAAAGQEAPHHQDGLRAGARARDLARRSRTRNG